MQKLDPIWQNLPLFFKSKVVEKLDYKDRCCLRKCSKSDLFLVDFTPNNLHSVAINTYENYSFFSWTDDGKTIYTVKYFKNLGENDLKIEFTAAPSLYVPGKNQKIIFKSTKFLPNLDPNSDDLDFVLIDFKIVLKKLICRKTIINDFILNDYHPMAQPDRTLELRERLLNILNQLKSEDSFKKYLVKSTCLHLKWHQETEEIAEILQVFDPKILKKLEFVDRKATWRLGKIVDLEQWKKAENVHMEVFTDFKVDDLAHFSEIQMHVKRMDEKDLWKVIQNFTTKNQHGASFHFSYFVEDPDLQRILSTFNVPPINQPIRTNTQVRNALEQRILHTQRFQMSFPNLVLVVMIADKYVTGTVCHVDNVDVEAKVETGLLR